ncbi:MAG TPA: hypothetical protein VFS05_07250 [Gemmatimonadaceae bacterium]|nr:hypothetical protein [Gemmatimonadaceae bacterium]
MRFLVARSLAAAFSILSLTSVVAGQRAPRVTRPGVVWLPWGSVHVLLVADSVDGVMLWAATTKRVEEEQESRRIVARIAPEAVAAWEARAAAVLSAEGAAPPDPSALLLAELRTLDGSVVALGRSQKRGKWAREALLYFREREGEPLIVRGTIADARSLAGALTMTASMSVVRPDSARWPERTACAELAADTGCAEVRGRPDNPPPRGLPGYAYRGGTAEIWTRFDVDSTGQVDMRTFEVLLSEDPALTDAVTTVLPSWRFIPARRGGRAVRARVHQRFIFSAP